MGKAVVIPEHEHVTRQDIVEGFFNPEKKLENEEKGRFCPRCSLALMNYRIMMSGADVAASESQC